MNETKNKKNKVFISGSISIEKIPQCAINSLDKMIENECEILVGDALGVDSQVQEHFKNKGYIYLTIYTIEKEPRNKKSDEFDVKKVKIDELEKDENKIEYDKPQANSKPTNREKQGKKDMKMVEDCDFALCIWDGKSKGSYNNMLNLIKSNKKFKLCFKDEIYENPEKEFLEQTFRENNGYNLKELREELENREVYFKSENEMKKFLNEEGIQPSGEFKDKFIKKYNKKYNNTTYAYGPELVDIIEKKYNKNDKMVGEKEIDSDEIINEIEKEKAEKGQGKPQKETCLFEPKELQNKPKH